MNSFRRAEGALLGAITGFMRRFHIYKRLTASFMVTVLLSGAAISIVALYICTTTMQRNITDSTHLFLGSVNTSVDIMFSGYEYLATQIGSDPQVRQLLSRCRSLWDFSGAQGQDYLACKRELGFLLYQYAFGAEVSSIEILSSYDEFTEVGAQGEPQGASLRDSQAFRNSEDYRKAVAVNSAILWSDTSKEMGVWAYRRSQTLNLGYYLTLYKAIQPYGVGEPLGVIILNIPLGIFQHFVTHRSIFSDAEAVFLAGSQGTTVMLNGFVRFQHMPDTATVMAIVGEGDGARVVQTAGTDKLLVYSACRRMNMVVAYMVDRASVYGTLYLVQKIIVAVTAACIAGSLLLSYCVTASISQPLKALQHTMADVGGAEGLQAHYQDTHMDEVGALGKHFNAMILRIQELLARLVSEEKGRKAAEFRRKDAELDALQMQIDPHFLYNTLDIIRWNAMLAENGEGQVSRMLAAFSAFLRFNTISMCRLVNLEEELAHIQAYVRVLNFRQGMQVVLESDIEAGDLLQCQLPKLTLQPIVENAVKHGLLETGKPLKIGIRARRVPEGIGLSVRDNGRGIPLEKLALLNQGLASGTAISGSIGLRNVNERLQLLFGEGYGLHLDGLEGVYTEVTVHIPDHAMVLLGKID